MKYQRAFTLVELIIVIVLTGIIGVSMMVFFKPTIDAYFDARRRAEMTDIADTALQRISRDIRSAVPNSIRPWEDIDSYCIEFVPTSGGGRYRIGRDPGSATAQPLEPGQPTFDVLSPLSKLPEKDDWVVIGNHGPQPLYAADSKTRAQILDVGAANTERTASLDIGDHPFEDGYDGRFVVVPYNEGNPAVVYVCRPDVDAAGNGTGTLSRVTRGFTPSLSSCPAGGATLATGVSACRFSDDAQDGFLRLQLELRESGESVALVYGVHVSNVP